MNLALYGSPLLAANTFSRLLAARNNLGFDVAYIVTQPAKPVGRKKIITNTDVFRLAQTKKIPVYTSTKDIPTSKIDIAILFAYGEMISKRLLDMPTYGFWNVHPSLLPKYRGASPIALPILLGDSKTGVSLMKMDEKLDHGPIIDSSEIELTDTITSSLLQQVICETSSNLLLKALKKIIDGATAPKYIAQNNSQATYTWKFKSEDGFIQPELFLSLLTPEKYEQTVLPPIYQKWYEANPKEIMSKKVDYREIVSRMYRALQPWPGLWTILTINSKLTRVKVIELDINLQSITKVQIEGKTPILISDFIKHYTHII